MGGTETPIWLTALQPQHRNVSWMQNMMPLACKNNIQKTSQAYLHVSPQGAPKGGE